MEAVTYVVEQFVYCIFAVDSNCAVCTLASSFTHVRVSCTCVVYVVYVSQVVLLATGRNHMAAIVCGKGAAS